MTLNDSGLPQPGRELDAWIAEHVLGWQDVVQWVDDGWNGWEPSEFDGKQARRLKHVPAYSTTHAYHSVMEAMEEQSERNWFRIKSTETLTHFALDWRRAMGKESGVMLKKSDYPDREHAYAYAVCAAAWMALGGQNA